MRRMLAVGGASLGLHTLLFFLFDGYRELAFRVGLVFPHHRDIADISRRRDRLRSLSHRHGRGRRPFRASLEKPLARDSRERGKKRAPRPSDLLISSMRTDLSGCTQSDLASVLFRLNQRSRTAF